ncbi:ferredoxin-3, chloroplastic isoform X1 [Ananas comosus]|uniref:Ferredoxin-3, chloroplastic isoform X1 n=1 Tax=Ananas comosus TaxID=4615 RepID=A0A6P5GS06_ANACO|nr:ferredoxin-3, chloroplastic isoform X1 [Ananas comosus]
MLNRVPSLYYVMQTSIVMMEPQLLLSTRSFSFLSSSASASASSSVVVNRRCFFRKSAATPSPCGSTMKKRATGKASASLSSETSASSQQTSAATAVVPTHRVTVHDRQRGVVHQFLVPEDQYILHTAESQNISLPFACRHGCCTSCAVRIKSGQIRQPEALGISAELKSQGYALLCVGFPSSDIEVETQDEDEVYWLQFGRYFARGPIERDDYALELAMGDE